MKEGETPVPKRTGGLFGLTVSDENGVAAVYDMLKGKRSRAAYGKITISNRKEIKRIILKRLTASAKRGNVAYYRTHAEEIGRKVAAELREGRWVPRPYREKLTYDGLRGKLRRIKVPCLHDQVAHHAIMRVTAPHILRRNDWHNCGSIPKAGQTRATRIVKRWMARPKPPRYALTMDVRKFYDSCPHITVMAALRRIIKDKQLLGLHEIVLGSMGDGLAIGFYPSQWYANLVLYAVDRMLASTPGIDFVRYADDITVCAHNKRLLHRLRKQTSQLLLSIGLQLKRTWQVYPIARRGIAFLSYRFFAQYTVIRKGLLKRISRTMRSAGRNLTPHVAMAVESYMGIMMQCNCYRFKLKYVYPYITQRKIKEVIRYVENLCRVQRAALAIRGAARGE